MVTVSFSIPRMDNIPGGAPELYLWLAYFWGDVHTLSSPVNISVFLPPLADSRSTNQYGSADPAGGIAVPSQVGTLQINLDDGLFGIGMAGVLIALFEKHDTPDDAINAGYDAFGPALQQQIDTFLNTNGFHRPPTDQQILGMVKGVADAVTSAVSSKLSIWDKIFGTQDKNVGYSTAFFAGQNQLQVGEGTGIPNITPHPPSAYSQCSFPGGNMLIVQPPPIDPCAEQAAAVQAAIATIQNLTDQLHNLQVQLEGADHLERQRLKLEIDGIQKKQLPSAQTLLVKAQKELQHCRNLTGRQFGIGISNVSSGAKGF
ncbi:MAG TPA: hypothetical protein VFE35_05135 [Candidatus Cybelea sp.]|nr:hypothetical protein [Candidatus Cybelea sp.]